MFPIPLCLFKLFNLVACLLLVIKRGEDLFVDSSTPLGAAADPP